MHDLKAILGYLALVLVLASLLTLGGVAGWMWWDLMDKIQVLFPWKILVIAGTIFCISFITLLVLSIRD